MKSPPYPVTYLTPNLYITDYDIHIVDCLADNKEMPVNFEVSQVISFYVEADFHLVIYLCNKEDKGFQMYVIKDFSRNVKDLALLRDMFFRMTQEPGANDLFKKAYHRLDTLLHMAKTLRATIHKDSIDFEEE
jgi:hypothetical protein